MKRQTRTNVFETNSSSMHAICISKKQLEAFRKSKDIKEFGFPTYQRIPLKFGCDWYGRDFRVLTTPQEKASFLLTFIYYRFDKKEERTGKTKILEHTLSEFKIKCDIPPCPALFYSQYGMELSYSLVTSIENILSDKEKLVTFLLGDSFVVLGSDEDFDEDGYFKYVRKIKPEQDFWGNCYGDELQDDFDDYDVVEF